MRNSKTNRNTDIYQAYCGGATLRQLASWYGLSRERIRKITPNAERERVNARAGAPPLSAQSRHALTLAGLCDPLSGLYREDAIRSLSDGELLDIRNLGRKRLAEIRRFFPRR